MERLSTRRRRRTDTAAGAAQGLDRPPTRTEVRRLERQLLEISEREKLRLGQDLHDGLGQELSGIRFRLASLANHLKRQSHEKAEEARELVSLLSEAEGTTHDLAQGLYPVRDEGAGLSQALEDLTIRMANLYKARCVFRQPSPPPDGPYELSLHLFRIAQEAVANALKHAAASEVVVTLRTVDGRIHLMIEDDGKGLPERVIRARGRRGLGMDIMRYRSRLIGAQLTIESAPGRGTRVVCAAPVPARDGGKGCGV
jgi:signal transduction histidine kinase